jgi:hypothetical protein
MDIRCKRRIPAKCGWDFFYLLMLFTQQIVDGLYWVEGTKRYFYEDGTPIAHCTIPKTW